MASASISSSFARRLEGKVALIAGGATGIGKATAKLFAQQGARVVIADVQDEHGLAVSNELGGSSIASYIHCDVTSEPDVKNAVDTTVDRYGKLDIMFNNAGIAGSPQWRIIESEKSDFEKVLSINLLGCYLGTKHAARVMIPTQQGSIISTASVASLNPNGAPLAYACSKHAVVALMKSTAIELGKYGIRVNCVSPAGVATPMTTKALGMDEEKVEEFMAKHPALQGVKLKANDVAQAVMYLASDESRFVSGLNLVVDGAFSILSPLDSHFN
ncbi:NAD(P)-binding Rossmann-fold superfamily protein [Rhynchospora pubera]|uniref:NAD(P)-binding Rossmann-fold superfamily protein n=1 Tax=Rhynchospora pubera TaxID=906938 RepID=A0AAV8H4S7_9POAL|nr:NAD(P)-binding Rossmann-fold superfamily protein [Rhynchospora pubera]